MKQVMNYHKDNGLLNMIRRTDPMINTLSVDSINYVGDFIYENGQLKNYLFDGGYATISNGLPTYHYYAKDHLGNNRAVINHSTGEIEQVTHYYPFGAVYGDAGTNDALQRYKYNGKELDRMHGLNTYDYGARQYDPILARWDRIDPLCEKYYSVSSYVYCLNSPVNLNDPDGRNPIYDTQGNLLGCTSEGYTGQIYVYKGYETLDLQKQTMEEILEKDDLGDFMTFENVESSYSGDAKANFVSKVLTDIVEHAEGDHIFEYSFSTSTLHQGGIGFSLRSDSHFTTEKRWGENKIRIVAHEDVGKDYEATVENLSASLLVHEWYSHGVKGYGDANNNHRIAYSNVMKDKVFYPRTTKRYKNFIRSNYNYYKNKERRK